ncbi:MAG: 1-aminocyclopropane-1-carboxylate deaminase [halophilic archaeon J07HX64]|jgi:1-aminocyclopropane-1-carboxylate deaminase|nr:MAG: 1-aminocyclopropane-1-carboxylate deaminase [halophilic archaeon J07HX64]
MSVTTGVPRVDLGSFPTAVEAAPELGAALGVSELYLKRGDRSGQLYGGNKVRKLEFLLGAALDAGCTAVLTGGGVGSNHVLATAAYAREVGLEPRAVQFPQPVTGYVRENLRSLARFDPDLHLARSQVLFPASLLRARLATLRRGLSYVPLGGSSPVGTVGFVRGAQELARQVDRGVSPRPDVVVVPASSGGTLAGLVVGLDSTDLDTRVVGVRVAERYAANRLFVSRLANRTAALLDLPVTYSRADITLVDGYLGPGYAEPSRVGERVQKLAALYGLTLDPTYTAKTVAAIAGEFDDETVLYWHTLSGHRPEPLSTDEAVRRLPDSYRRFLT